MFSMLLRLIRSRDIERQHIKWFVYTAAFQPLAVVLIYLGIGVKDPGLNWLFVWLGGLLGVTTGAAMSVASAIAIFRYRLWDIDLVIRRTLIYTTLTVALTLIYLSSIVILQALFGAILEK